MLLPRKFDSAKSLLLTVLMLAFCVPTTAQSLGDVARQGRTANKPRASRVITNDDVESSGVTSKPAVSNETDKTAETSEADEAQKGDKPDQGKKAGKEQLSDAESWNKRVSDLQGRIAQLQKEVDELRTKQTQRIGVYYADAGTMLRDPAQWTKDQKFLEDETARKQTEIDDLRQQLDDAKERARKLGIRLPD